MSNNVQQNFSSDSKQSQVHDSLKNDKRALFTTKRVLMAIGVLAVIIGLFVFWYTGGRTVYVEDALVSANKLIISTDVSGIVLTVNVKPDQYVRKGQLLFTLEPQSYEYALAAAKAALAQVKQVVLAKEAAYRMILFQIKRQKARIALDRLTLERYRSLLLSGAVTVLHYDQEKFSLTSAIEALGELEAEAAEQLAFLDGNSTISPEDLPQYHEALAAVLQAQRNLNHTKVYAPFEGVVTQVSRLQPGEFLAASQAAFGLIGTDNMWISAEIKETDLTYIRSGDKAVIYIDAYPGHSWQGVVQSISLASSNSFSLLPAENASGNWVKVVQRIPVRVEFLDREIDFPLRDGMSAEVSIQTGHVRTLSDLVNIF